MSVNAGSGSFKSLGDVVASRVNQGPTAKSSFVSDFFDRYFDRYIEEPNSGCWLWIGSRTSGGYGNLREGGRSLYAHRASYEATHGCASADGVVIRHRCDNPACINPSHLLGGTYAENNADAWSRGRMHPATGERNSKSVLTEKDVRSMRQMAATGATLAEISALYPARRNAIQSAVTGATWKHVPGAVALHSIRKADSVPPLARGEQVHNAVLTAESAAEIKRRSRSGESGRALAKEFGVSPATVSAIKVGRNWSHV